jgi:long-chain acyl-CoA synthetase
MQALCVRLEARAPEQRCFRAYEIAAGRDLFGGWMGEITYGCIGAHGRTEPNQDAIGKIELRGPNVFCSHINNRQAIRRSPPPMVGSGPEASRRLDGKGFLYVTRRRGETIMLGSAEKVYPEALERLYDDSPHIREVVILERKRELGRPVLSELTATRTGPSAHIDDAIRVALAARAQALPSYQRLADYTLVHEPLPRMPLGKYQRFLPPALYERAAAGTLARFSEEIAHRSARRLYELIRNRYRDKPVHLDASPRLDLGISASNQSWR